MNEIAGTADHDLLIRIDTKLDLYRDQTREFETRVDREIRELRKDFDELRSSQTKSSGFFDGAKWLIAVIMALPAGVLAYMFGAAK